MSTYVPFDMCPLTQVNVGGSMTIGGTGGGSYSWTHGQCIGKYCKLYTFKTDENGTVYAEGCNLEFQGLTESEIKRNFAIKAELIRQLNAPKDPTKVLGIT